MRMQDMYALVGKWNDGGGTAVSARPLNQLGAASQMAHECGMRKDGSFISDTMNRTHNYAGIKCTSSWRKAGGRCFSAKTFEYVNEDRVDGARAFRAYDSPEHFLSDYARLIHSYGYYRLSAANPDCVWLYLAGMHGSWATDPNYFRLCTSMVVRTAPMVGITKEQLEGSFAHAMRLGFPEKWMAVAVADRLGL